MTTVPWAGWVTAVTVRVSPSGSVSLASTAIGSPGVLGDGGGVVDRDRGIVDRGDGDRHRGGVGGAGAVGDGVGEGVGAGVVRVGV